MYQIDVNSAASKQPASTALGTPGFFTDGNPGTGELATVVPAEWLNTIMLELLSTLKAAGVAPKKDQFDQLSGSVKALIQQGAVAYAADTGAANAYAATYAPAPVLTEGLVLRFKAANANSGPSTFAVNGGAAKPVINLQGKPLVRGEIAAGNSYWLQYTTTLVPTGAWVALFTSLDRSTTRRATRMFHASGM